MKKNKQKKLMIVSLMIVFCFAFILSCKKTEEPVAAPKAGFTTEVSGKTVTITNTTEGESVTYSWDFGDGSAVSTDAAPVYTYAVNGSYVIKVTATNEGGSDEAQAVLEIINITIDGDFSDWSETAFAVQYTDGEGGSTTGMKLENLENNKLFVYIEGTAELSSLTQIFLNTDNDRTTGAQIGWRYFEAGEDYLIEGQILADAADPGNQWYALFQCDGCAPGTWGWTETTIVDFVVASELITITGGKAYEFSIDLSLFPTATSTETVGIAVMDLLEFAEFGQMPKYVNETDCLECTLYYYTLK